MLYKTLLSLIIIVLFASASFSQKYVDINSLQSDYVKKKSRENFILELEQKINYRFSGKLNPETEKSWKSIFREIELANYRSEKVFMAAEEAIKYSLHSNSSFQRAAIELIYTLYPNDFYNDVLQISQTTQSAQVFATASMYLLNHGSMPLEKKLIRENLLNRFHNIDADPILKFLNLQLSEENQSYITETKLVELLSHPFQAGKTIIYSIHRQDRKYPGITIIKKPNGTFVRNGDSTIFSVNQLAHSTSKLPGYISQGNTPQGIFSVVGFYVSPTESIGPTPNVLTRIPFEVSTEIFYHKNVKSQRWAKDDYKNLLPLSWQDYPWIYESYYAGKSGRRLIVMHGSTDDLSFYKNEEYYPLTPSKGCLTTKEIWSEETGKIIESDQVKLMNAFYSTGQLYGFLVVLNLDDKKEPVSIDELLPLIRSAEENSSKLIN